METVGSFTRKVMVMTTSRESSTIKEGVDALTGESRLEEVPKTIHRIIASPYPLLAPRNVPCYLKNNKVSEDIHGMHIQMAWLVLILVIPYLSSPTYF